MNEFIRIVDNLIKARKALPSEIGTVMVRFSKDRFKDQAWQDNARKPWVARKKRREGGKRKSQTLLVDTGRLKRSIRKVSVSQTDIVIGTDVPYAEIHNNGGKITTVASVKSFTKKAHTRKAHTRTRKGNTESIEAQRVQSHRVKARQRKMNITIKQRQFMGNSTTLAKEIEDLIIQRFEKAMMP